MASKRIVVGISGASGAVYGLRCLELLKGAGWETHLVVSRAGELTLRSECDMGLKDLGGLCDELHPIGNVGASIASGSFRTAGMIIAPCSIRTLGEIVAGVTSTLLTRAADVVLKEQSKLVLMVRETPLHLGHLRTLTAAAEIGAVIAPPMPAFYNNPKTLDDIVIQSAGRALDAFGVDVDIVRWQGMKS
jgi:flavin prenyltransferase